MLEYKTYDKKSYIVFGDKEKYNESMENIGRWSSSNSGWIVSKDKENDLKKLINFINTYDNIKVNSRKNQKKYHREISESETETDSESEDEKGDNNKNKTKKHSDSDNEESHDNNKKTKKLTVRDKDETRNSKNKSKKYSDSESDIDEENLNPIVAKLLEKEKLKSKYTSSDPISYYKSFNSNPSSFKEINDYISPKHSESEDSFASSSESSESEDSFPEPRTPKKRQKYNPKINENYNDLYKEVKHLQKKIYEIEIENKKLKSKNM